MTVRESSGGPRSYIPGPELRMSSNLKLHTEETEAIHPVIFEVIRDAPRGRRRGEGVEPSGNRNSCQAGFEDRWGHRAPSSSSASFARTCSGGRFCPFVMGLETIARVWDQEGPGRGFTCRTTRR